MQGDLPLERLGDNVLRFLAQYLDAQVGGLFVAEGGGSAASRAYATAAGDVALLRPGEGLAGQAAKDSAPMHVRDVPADYLPVGSATGSAPSRELLIAPGRSSTTCYAVMEFGFLGKVRTAEGTPRRVAEPLAAAVRASKDRSRLEELLQETQQQAEELQTREEELRVNNEELEEQWRALRESRAQLESQQAELEQTNSQLEEQAQTLEHQKDALARRTRSWRRSPGAAARQRVQERVPREHEP